LDQFNGASNDVVNDKPVLICIGCVYTALEHTAAMSVRRNIQQVGANLVINELIVMPSEGEKAFLDDMIPVDVFGQFEDVVVKHHFDSLYLVRLFHCLYELLDCSCAVGVNTYHANEWCDALNDVDELIIIA
jgi:hypothetical protein